MAQASVCGEKASKARGAAVQSNPSIPKKLKIPKWQIGEAPPPPLVDWGH